MTVGAKRAHKWKGYSNAAGYGWSCVNCHVVYPYLGQGPKTPCPGKRATLKRLMIEMGQVKHSGHLGIKDKE